MKNVVVKKTPGKGKGVFALRNFAKGEIVIAIHYAKIIPEKIADEMPQRYLDHMSYTGHGMCAVMTNPGRFVNHSCDPNSYFQHVDTHNENVIAIKPIKKGQEITVDYRVDSVDSWEMKCSCGAKNCSGIVKGPFTTLDKKTRKKYAPYVPYWNKKYC